MNVRFALPPGRRVLVATAVGLALVGGACTGDPAPPPTPTPPPTTSPPPTTPTPTPTPPPPTLPPAARPDTPAAAESFARYYLQALDYAYRTGNTAPVRAAAKCAGCDAVAHGIEAWYQQGGHYEGGLITVERTNVLEFSSSRALVRAIYSRADRSLVSSSGDTELVKGEYHLQLAFTEARKGDKWSITNIQQIA